ncbi:hypothetical protein [Microcoleus sp. herbarium5]|uniref:hypothetical protein n=1 Tax=Microcoleus sp. herbarium5 TaxID=3055434 RepID=UPI002FD40580
MLPTFYQTHLQKQLTQSPFILLTIFLNLIESEKQVTIALIGFPLITYWLTTYCPIAYFSQIRSPINPKTRSHISLKFDRPETD